METTNLVELYDAPLMAWDVRALDVGFEQVPDTSEPGRHTRWLVAGVPSGGLRA